MSNIIGSFSDSKGLNGEDYKKHWVKIDKDRILLKYDLTTLVEGKVNVSEGTGIEFTPIKSHEKIYYSLGLESFSKTNKEEKNFFDTISYLSEAFKVFKLSSDNSHSYPQFLRYILNK